MRSSWEIEYAKFLDTKGISWLYESKRFTLSDGRTYTPDFYLPATNTYVEIKGHWFPAAKAKFAMFKKEFHNVKIIVIEDKLWH